MALFVYHVCLCARQLVLGTNASVSRLPIHASSSSVCVLIKIKQVLVQDSGAEI